MSTWGYGLTHIDLEQARVTAFIERADWQKVRSGALTWTFDSIWEGIHLGVLIPTNPPQTRFQPTVEMVTPETSSRFLGGMLKDEVRPYREVLALEVLRQLSRDQLKTLRERIGYEVTVLFAELTPAARRAFLRHCQEYDRRSKEGGQDKGFFIDYTKTNFMRVIVRVAPQAIGSGDVSSNARVAQSGLGHVRLYVDCEARLFNGVAARF
jgi:hypothetical protein